MNIWEIVKMSAAALKGNKLRSLLTALGIIFGVGAVIALISIAQGASKGISDQIANMGSNLITVSPFRGTSLSREDAQELLERVPTISDAVPSVSFNATVKWSTKTYDTYVEGVSEGYPGVRNTRTQSGRFFSAEEVENRQRVAVVGKTVADELFGGGLPLGESIIIRGQSFSIIGILEEKGAAMGRDSDDTVLIPVTVAQRMTGTKSVGTIYVKARSAEEASLAVSHIASLNRNSGERILSG